ncbi:hypothetical protein C8R47DRAFT_1225006 [Mycena vitilis]|nr:hypothetical protein C8R47DRAFT_1225006 [Mycena vitilis]
MNGNTDPTQSSALYQYAVPAAVFLFAAISVVIYLRSSLRGRPSVGPSVVVTVRNRGERQRFDASMKPPIYDAYIADGGGVEGKGKDGEGPRRWGWDAEAQTRASRDWAEIMPLSASNLAAVCSESPTRTEKGGAGEPGPLRHTPATNVGAGVDPRPPDATLGRLPLDLDVDLKRVLVSVIVRMPNALVSSPVALGKEEGEKQGVGDEDGEVLPYLELGLVEVDVLRGGIEEPSI